MKVKDFIEKLKTNANGVFFRYKDEDGYTYEVKTDIDSEFVKIVNDWEIEEINITQLTHNRGSVELVINRGY